MVLTLLIFAVLNISLAFIDAHKIFKGNTINHVINAAVYIAMVAVSFFIFHNVWLIIALLFNRLLVFNIALSLFRGLNWDYVTPENPPKSIIDRIAKMVFGMNGKLMYGVYAAVFIVLIIIIFI